MARILYVWKSPFPWDVRAEKICLALSESGHEVIMLCRWIEGQKKEEYYRGIHIIRSGYEQPWRFATPVSMNPLWVHEIKKVATEYKASIIIVREIMLASACASVAQNIGVPVVMDMAEHYPAAMKLWKKYRKNILKNAFVHWFHVPEKVEEITVPKMDGIITVCSEQCHRLKELYNFPFHKMRIVHNTPHISNFTGIRLGSDRPPKIFGHHGYMTAEKNLDKLIMGFLIAASQNHDIELHLAGSGDCEEELKLLAKNSRFGNRIHFLGGYNPKEMNNFLSSFDVGVIPYESNNFNDFTIHNKIFDYFGAGKPVIITNTPPYKRLLEEIGAGLIVDCGNPDNIADAICRMVESDVVSYAIKGLNAFYMKYNWSYDKMNLINFINSFL